MNNDAVNYCIYKYKILTRMCKEIYIMYINNIKIYAHEYYYGCSAKINLHVLVLITNLTIGIVVSIFVC